MRSTYTAEMNIVIAGQRNYRNVVAIENSRESPFLKALCRYLNRQIPDYHKFSFGKEFKDLSDLQKLYLAHRNKKDTFVLTLSYWAQILENVIKEEQSIYQWMAMIHFDSVFIGSPLVPISFLLSYDKVLTFFPPFITQLYADAVIEASTHAHPPHLIRALFPETPQPKEEEDLFRVPDDLVRDIFILANGHRFQQGITNVGDKLSKKPLSKRSIQFIADSNNVPFDISRRGQYLYCLSNEENSKEKTSYPTTTAWYQEVVANVLMSAMQRIMLPPKPKSKKEKDREEGVFERYVRGEKVSLPDLFRSHGADPELFCVFICWLSRHNIPKALFSDRPEHRMSNSERQREIFLNNFPAMVKLCFASFGQSLLNRKVAVGTVRSTNIPLVHPALETCSFVNTQKLMQSLEDEIRTCFEQIKNMDKLCKRFTPKSEVLEILAEVLDEWKNLRMVNLSYLFRKALVKIDTDSGKPCPGPLPEVLIDSLDWFVAVSNSPLFQYVWAENDCFNDIPKLPYVKRDWDQLWSQLLTKSLPFPRLTQLLSSLLNEEELTLLYTSAAPIIRKEGGEYNDVVWFIRQANQRILSAMTESLNRFSHLQNVLHNLESVEACIPYFSNWIKDHSTIDTFEECVGELKSLQKSLPWDQQVFGDYEKFIRCEDVHPSYLNPKSILFQKMLESMDLFEWLRTQADDQDFQRGLEMAMGRGEMECPAELWVEGEEGQTGRVNERVLSMLQSVRTYLHPFIYRESLIYPDLDAFTNDLMARLGPYEDEMILKIDTSNDFRLPLIELLSSNADSAAPDRLLRMLQPASKARWVCDSRGMLTGKEDEIVGGLSLEYVASKKDQKAKSLSSTEIEDFQSSVVLSRTDQRGEDTRQKIRNFVDSFEWIKQLASTLSTLHRLGHFDYDFFFEEFPLQTNSEDIRARTLECREILFTWEKLTKEAREKFPAMNNFGMKLIWEFAKVMKTLVMGGFSAKGSCLIRQMAYLVNPEVTMDALLLQNMEEDLVKHWREFTKDFSSLATEAEPKEEANIGLNVAMDDTNEDEEVEEQREMSLKELLDCCGKVINSVFGLLSPPKRVVKHSSVLSMVAGELRLITARSHELVFLEVLSLFVMGGQLPDRRNLVLCRESTTWEEVMLLLLRWSQAEGGSDPFFCIASADLLPNSIQVKLVSFVQDQLAQGVPCPLVIVCGPGADAYVVSQFTNRRKPSFALGVSDLQQMVDQAFESRVKTYVSDHAGAGKSFQIRKGNFFGGERYIHAPATTVPQHLGLLEEVLNSFVETAVLDDDEDMILHIDLYDTVGTELNSYLFEFIFFNGHCNFEKEIIFFYPPSRTSISVEIPTGPLSKHMTVPWMCPIVKVAPEPDLFATCKKDLERGMGKAMFYGKRYDGTALRKREEGKRHANAWERLQYVCTALEILKHEHGRFPYVFETNVEEPEALLESLRLSASGMGLGEGDITGDTCFGLLAEASGVLAEKASLWCMWNFVNMVYWQIRDMHYPDSPLNSACMPTGGEEKSESEDEKRLVKGEILAFILRTAREFATRQSNEVAPDEVTGLTVRGFQNHQFNGNWKKHIYEHDGKEVFSTRGYQNMTFFMYYRALEEIWVIDDVIAAEGPSFSHTTLPDYNTPWRTSAGWEESRSIRSVKVRRTNAYLAEAYEFKGFPSSDENGVYERQPPYDNVSGKPHYIKLEGTRRHLFYMDSQWQICPLCNLDEGAFAICNKVSFQGAVWSVIPNDIVERGVSISKVLYDSNPIETPQEEKIEMLPDFMLEEDSAERILQKKNEDFQEFLALEKLFEKTKKWQDSNHESLLFSNKNHVVSFLSMNPKKMKTEMHPNLLAFLEQNRINVGESLDTLSSRHHEILGALTEVYRSAKNSKGLMGGNYCLTGDNLLKMLAVFIRLRVGIPVILMGECGCGKTALLKYLCAWLGVDLNVLDVHGGTTPEDIVDIFVRAEEARKSSGQPAYVFLDEVNACNHMGLICEVIANRSLNGNPIHDDIHILAALNPYRRRPPQEETFGLVYKHKKGSHSPLAMDEMSTLVYRVTPVPTSLRDFVFDFGALEQAQETLYIHSMIKDMLQLPSLDDLDHRQMVKKKREREQDWDLITALITAAQTYIRQKEGDPSSVSLRDVKRFILFVNFFLGWRPFSKGSFVSSVVVSISLVYYFRLSKAKDRTEFWTTMCYESNIARESRGSSFHMSDKMIEKFKKFPPYFKHLLELTQNGLCQHLELEDGIALNNALTENLFVTIVCILTRVPVFLVGKPGTSKTLTLQIIASNLQGEQSPKKYWRKYPSVYVFPYQCSPMSDSRSIQHQFDMAVRYQEYAHNTITVLLLDEVGLAEHSPEMPLKCLHGMLVDPPIAVVGLSNWVLDPAKMNRAILVQRPEPNKYDIANTGASIMGLSPQREKSKKSPLMEMLEKVSQAYFYVYTHQKGRDFIGMRDFYSLIKHLRQSLPRSEEELLASEISHRNLIFSLCRNFGGRPDILRDMLLHVNRNLYGKMQRGKAADIDENTIDYTLDEIMIRYGFKVPPLPVLMKSNIVSPSARHLMLLTKNSLALSLVFSLGLAKRDETKVIIGSEFSEDDTELYLVHQMNEVKLAMATGKLIVLMNADNMYEALYDVLNQRYLIKKNPETGETQKLLRLAIGSRSSLCHVEEGFRIIVIVEQEAAYRDLDLPLLNRFEKQILTPTEVLEDMHHRIVASVTDWTGLILKECGLDSLQHVFCGFHPGTISSAVFNLSQQHPESQLEDAVRRALRLIASPAAMALSPSLVAVEELDGKPLIAPLTLTEGVESLLARSAAEHVPKASLIMTHSPVSHLNHSLRESIDADVEVVRLDEVKSEQSFETVLEKHFSKLSDPANTEKKFLLVVQFDPITCSPLQINHAKFLSTNRLMKIRPRPNTPSSGIVFLVHMPPGVRARSRTFVLDFEHPWESLFLDDIRGTTLESGETVDIPTLLDTPLMKLFDMGLCNLEEQVMSLIPTALCRVRQPSPMVNNPLNINGMTFLACPEDRKVVDLPSRIELLKTALENQAFKDLFIGTVVAILKEKGQGKNKAGAYLHAELAIGDMSCGTMIESLVRTLQELVMQAMVHVLFFFEKNFTFSTIRHHPELWMAFASNKNIFDPSTRFMTASLGGKAVFRKMQTKYADNNGRSGTFVSTFPFSYFFYTLLNGDETRKAIAAAVQKQIASQKLSSLGATARFELEREYLDKVFSSFFGEKIVSLVQKGMEKEGVAKLDYLHDFVSLSASPILGMNYEEVELVYRSVLLAFDSRALSSAGAVHAAFRFNSHRIQVICSVLSTIPQDARKLVLGNMYEAAVQKEGEGRLSVLIEAVFQGVVDTIWAESESLPFFTRPLGLLLEERNKFRVSDLILSLEKDVHDLLTDWVEFSDMDGSKQGDMKGKWKAVLVLKIFLQSIMKEAGDWGTGEVGQGLLKLIQSSDVSSSLFFDQFCIALANMYSYLICCVDCGRMLGHRKDESEESKKKLDSLHKGTCSMCWNKRGFQEAQGHQFNSHYNFHLPRTFWNYFLSSADDRKREFCQDFFEIASMKTPSLGDKSKPEKKSLLVPKRGNHLRFLKNILVRYTDEILLPSGVSRAEFDEIDPALLQHFCQLVNFPTPSLIFNKAAFNEEEVQALECDLETPLRTSLMNTLLRAEHDVKWGAEEKGEGKAVIAYKTLSVMGEKLFLAQERSRLRENLEKRTDQERSNELTLLLELLDEKDFEVASTRLAKKDDEEKKRGWLLSVAKVQTVLEKYGSFMGSDSFPSEKMDGKQVNQFMDFFNVVLAKKTKATSFLRIYVLKVILNTAGMDPLLGFLFSAPERGATWCEIDSQQMGSLVQEECPMGPIYSREMNKNGQSMERFFATLFKTPSPEHMDLLDRLPSFKMETFIGALYESIGKEVFGANSKAQAVDRVLSTKKSTAKYFQKAGKRFEAKAASLAFDICLRLHLKDAPISLLPVDFIPQKLTRDQMSSQENRKPLDPPAPKKGRGKKGKGKGKEVEAPPSSNTLPQKPQNSKDVSFTLDPKTVVLMQLQLRILNMFLTHKKNFWLRNLAEYPSEFSERYFPASDFQPILGGLRWFVIFCFALLCSVFILFFSHWQILIEHSFFIIRYHCPNGHPYSVGECGLPMQQGTCPVCKAPIGGQSHRNVAGVKAVNINPLENFNAHTGYRYSMYDRMYRLPQANWSACRLIVDLALFTAIAMGQGSPVAKLLKTQEDRVRDLVKSTVQTYLGNLSSAFRVDNSLMGIALNSLVYKLEGENRIFIEGALLNSKAGCTTIEQGFNVATNIFYDVSQAIKTVIDSSFQSKQREAAVQKCLGSGAYDDLMEFSAKPGDGELWSYAACPSMDHFQMAMSGDHVTDARYPILPDFIAQEQNLQLVQHIVPILEWHRVLFTVFQNNEITREQAREITNKEAVNRLPTQEQRVRAAEILDEYCVAFNASFHLVVNLYQCQENPFLTEDKKVALNGNKTFSPMTPETVVAFSIPSMSPGENDATGLCTVQLLHRLHRIHEDALGLGAQGVPRRRRRRNEEDKPKMAKRDEGPNYSLPEISCDTPRRQLRQSLIFYDRQRDLIPLLNTYNNQKYEYGTVEPLTYDYNRIEEYLRIGVLGGKQSVRLHIRHFQFQGDVRSSGQVGGLKNRVKQQKLSESIMQVICGEIDTKNRIVRLLSFLEIIVGFLTSVGGQKVVGQMGIGQVLLRNYAIETIHIDAQEWDEVATMSVNEHVRMCHLQCLFLRLEEMMTGSPLDDVKDAYREPIDEKMKDEVRRNVEKHQDFYFKVVFPSLRDFMVQRMTAKEESVMEPSLPLKEYLEYHISDEDYDAYDDLFVDTFSLKHAFSLFQYLNDLQ